MIYEVWSEGYSCNGGRGYAHHHGSVEANSFEEACSIIFEGIKLYDPKTKTYWGCRLFDNESDARRNYG